MVARAAVVASRPGGSSAMSVGAIMTVGAISGVGGLSGSVVWRATAVDAAGLTGLATKFATSKALAPTSASRATAPMTAGQRHDEPWGVAGSGCWAAPLPITVGPV